MDYIQGSRRHPDYFLLASVFLLTIMGLLILTSASSELGKTKFNDSYYFLKHQITNGLLVGAVGLAITTFLNYRAYRRLAITLLIINLCLLALVFTRFGVISGGASRWLSFYGFSFQPAEFLKITFTIYIAAWLTNPKFNRAGSFLKGTLPFLVICSLIAALLIPQPATSTVVILLGSGIVIFFSGGARLKHILWIMGLGAVALSVIVLSSPYRLQRVMTFISPSTDTQGSAFQINQALNAIGSGGLFGIGYGKSAIKINSLPAPIGDSIFAVAAQELGFVGAGILISLSAVLVLRLLYLASRTDDRFGGLLLIGFASIIGLQSIVHIGAISGLLPLTGVPLPFVSFGGTALAVFLTMMGISLNISRRA